MAHLRFVHFTVGKFLLRKGLQTNTELYIIIDTCAEVFRVKCMEVYWFEMHPIRKKENELLDRQEDGKIMQIQ